MGQAQPQSVKGQREGRSSGGGRGRSVAEPLPATKLHAPALPPALVARRRLHEALAEGLSRPLTLIAAPAGWGKTTLLGEWIAGRSGQAGRVAWVSLDASDNDPVRFWTGALAALQGARPGVSDGALALLSSPRPPPLEAVVTALLNGLAAHPAETVLVLDDYHAVEAEPVHQSLTFLLEHLPPRFHLVIATRVDPPLALARMRARGALGELRADDLRFTPQESEAYLTGAMGLRLDPADVAALEARTEGWITGLQLAALAVRGRPDPAGFVAAFTGSHRFVVDYLVEEVLAQQPGEVQAFLLQTAVLDRMCGPLCDAVTAATSSETGRDAAGAAGPPRDDGARRSSPQPCSRKGRRSWSAWSTPTCSSPRSTTSGAGTATTTSSPRCCGGAWPAGCQARPWRPCTGAPARGSRARGCCPKRWRTPSLPARWRTPRA